MAKVATATEIPTPLIFYRMIYSIAAKSLVINKTPSYFWQSHILVHQNQGWVPCSSKVAKKLICSVSPGCIIIIVGPSEWLWSVNHQGFLRLHTIIMLQKDIFMMAAKSKYIPNVNSFVHPGTSPISWSYVLMPQASIIVLPWGLHVW